MAEYDHGRGAELLTARHFFGLTPEDMALALAVRVGSYKSWESGRDAIPRGVWADLERLYERFDEQVTNLVEEAGTGDEPHRVRVWRGRTTAQPLPGFWLRVVGDARRRNPRILPVYPEDDE